MALEAWAHRQIDEHEHPYQARPSSGSPTPWWWGYTETVSPCPPRLHRISLPLTTAAFFGPTVANGAVRTWLDLQLAPPCRDWPFSDLSGTSAGWSLCGKGDIEQGSAPSPIYEYAR
jgi:hypothetical protein